MLKSFTVKAVAYSIALALALPMMSSTAFARPRKATKTATTKTTRKPAAKKAAPSRKPAAKRPATAAKNQTRGKKPAAKPAKPAKPAPKAAPGNPESEAQELVARFLDDKDNSISWLCTVDKLTTILKGQRKYNAALASLKATRNVQNPIAIGKKLEAQFKSPAGIDLLNEKSSTLIYSYSKIQLLNLMKKRIKLNGKVPCS